MATEAEKARWRAWYHRTRETRLAYQRDWHARNKEQQRAYRLQRGDNRRYRDRKAYMREWHAKLKAQHPDRYGAYLTRSNKTRALKGLPSELHDMRTVLFEFRSKLHREGRV